MSRFKKAGPLIYPEDTPETKAIINWLRDSKIHFARKTRHHIKTGSINFYLGKGTIYIDDELQPRSDRGFEALKQLLTRPRKDEEAATILLDMPSA
jgi:hypothetical protein